MTSKSKLAKDLPPRPVALKDLQKRIHYRFKDIALLEEALTHSSAAPDGVAHYERLEFLGDRVLGLVVADTLLKRNPNAEEGALARALNALVQKEACVVVARKIDLGPLILMDEGEVRQGGREKKGMLGDTCESVIAAIFLDGGYDAAEEFIIEQWADQFEAAKSIRPDAKTALQEWAHQAHGTTPEYEVIERTGPDHAPQFRIGVHVGDGRPTEGSGKSKRDAEREAAMKLLEREGVW